MINKTLRSFQVLIALVAAGFGIFCLCIYKKDFGVPYKGRARLDYNWKYCFAELPKEEYTFNGRLFSYKYPKFKVDREIAPIENENGGYLVDSHWVLTVTWYKKDPAIIKTEFLRHLSGKEPAALSWEFRDWLHPNPPFTEFKGYHEDYDKLYDTKLEKIRFKHGGEALLVSFLSKVPDRAHMKIIAGITPGGQLFKASIRVRYNVSQETYQELVFFHHTCRRIPEPDHDAQSAYFLKKFIETLEFKK